ncbi:MAG: ORF6N domain-containing protein, partial [Bacteroidetes bacterium]|nr:ORF6N domain-containing protein [Bacteroidota bacterium]
GQKVMLDRDLAVLYGVPTKSLNLAVKRNRNRFPDDFMFQLNKEEYNILRFQSETSKRGGRRYLPHAFTEHGVLMLSSVLNSQRVIQVNIQIMRIYTRFREMLLTNKDLLLKMEQIEKEVSVNKKDIKTIFEMLNKFIETKQKPRTPMIDQAWHGSIVI